MNIPKPKYKHGDKIKHAYTSKLGVMTIRSLLFRIYENADYGSWYYMISEEDQHGIREDLVVLVESSKDEINYDEIDYTKNWIIRGSI